MNLFAAFPPALIDFLKMIAAQAEALNFPVYLVGGIVRDLLLTSPITAKTFDLDVVVEGSAPILAYALADRHGGSVTAHTPFGTAEWQLPTTSGSVSAPSVFSSISEISTYILAIQFATTRRERYMQPAALPTVELLPEPGALKIDVQRRDFTINTLAVQLTSDNLAASPLIDFLGAQADIQAQYICVLHDRSFEDDPTRLFRAARFAARLDFALEAHTAALIPAALPYIADLSGERIRHELDLILADRNPAQALRLLHSYDVLREIGYGFPLIPPNVWQRIKIGLTFDTEAQRMFEFAEKALKGDSHTWLQDARQSTLYWILLTYRQTSKEVRMLASSLHMVGPLADELEQGGILYRLLPELTDSQAPSQIARRLRQFSPTALAAAWIIAQVNSQMFAVNTLTRYMEESRFRVPTLNGDDLIAMGLRPGPLFGKLLHRLQDAWIDGEITNPTQERERLQLWIETGDSRGE